MSTEGRVGNTEHLGQTDSERLNLTARVGLEVEHGIVKQLMGKVNPDVSMMIDLKMNTNIILSSIWWEETQKTRKSEDLAFRLTHILGPVTVISFVRNQVVRRGDICYPAMRSLYKDVDYLFGSDFDNLFQERSDEFKHWAKLNNEYGNYDNYSIDMKYNQETSMRRYILEGALALARFTTSPLKLVDEGKWLLPDVRLKFEGKTVAQIDGAVVQKGAINKTAKWLESGNPRYLPTSRPWEAIEIKTLFSPSYATADDKPKDILKNHKRQFKHKLALLMLKIPDFLPPSKVRFIYPHGLMSSVVRSMDLDDTFYESWQNDIKNSLHSGETPDSLLAPMGQLFWKIDDIRKKLK